MTIGFLSIFPIVSPMLFTLSSIKTGEGFYINKNRCECAAIRTRFCLSGFGWSRINLDTALNLFGRLNIEQT